MGYAFIIFAHLYKFLQIEKFGFAILLMGSDGCISLSLTTFFEFKSIDPSKELVKLAHQATAPELTNLTNLHRQKCRSLLGSAQTQVKGKKITLSTSNGEFSSDITKKEFFFNVNVTSENHVIVW